MIPSCWFDFYNGFPVQLGLEQPLWTGENAPVDHFKRGASQSRKDSLPVGSGKAHQLKQD